jgi:hypothetical protein
MISAITLIEVLAFRHVYLDRSRKVSWLASSSLSAVFTKNSGQELSSLCKYCPFHTLLGRSLRVVKHLYFQAQPWRCFERSEILSGPWASQVVPEIWVLYHLVCANVAVKDHYTNYFGKRYCYIIYYGIK